MSAEFAVGVLALLDSRVEGVVDAVELVPHVSRTRLHQCVHVSAQFH